jgi:hypothetical protein
MQWQKLMRWTLLSPVVGAFLFFARSDGCEDRAVDERRRFAALAELPVAAIEVAEAANQCILSGHAMVT